ncbi:hypothetical protein J3F83DRAFT_741223 [Trichoderma novae-zelandiae]
MQIFLCRLLLLLYSVRVHTHNVLLLLPCCCCCRSSLPQPRPRGYFLVGKGGCFLPLLVAKTFGEASLCVRTSHVKVTGHF